MLGNPLRSALHVAKRKGDPQAEKYPFRHIVRVERHLAGGPRFLVHIHDPNRMPPIGFESCCVCVARRPPRATAAWGRLGRALSATARL